MSIAFYNLGSKQISETVSFQDEYFLTDEIRKSHNIIQEVGLYVQETAEKQMLHPSGILAYHFISGKPVSIISMGLDRTFL